MSTEPRAATVPVLVVKSMEIEEPDWCVDPHEHAQFRPDITHYGPEQHLTFRGEPLWTVMLAQAPYSSSPQVGVYIEQGRYTGTLDAAGLRELADAQQAHADYLRRLADQIPGGEQ
ncbi:DUF6907 domain-containing protein [Streptomyces griseosporeus]|uniref:DUF6907 domain-containing protein n=1 Tax=Streptomyces griseosporeus TaxID=1910 RepID=UPI00167D589E|nr:hypothetical protein [Streptomyces griseosporeus]GHF57914.1 hypothetical protein GCM10018783_29110 [Streptomyces griseosporeus]